MVQARWHRLWCAVFVCVSAFGCNQAVDPGPSYAELVVTYNAELEALDRLEAKRATLVKEYEMLSASSSSADVLSKVEGLLNSASDLKDSMNLDPTSDPNEILENMAERSGEAQELAGQLLEGVLGGESNDTKPEPTPEEAAVIAERKATFETELAKLDLELTEQKTRVERARLARDAAEANP